MNTSPRFAHSYALQAHQDDITAIGGCNCCAAIVGRTPQPRRYWWTGQNGRRKGLCQSCFDIYRAEASQDPALAPILVEESEPTGPRLTRQ